MPVPSSTIFRFVQTHADCELVRHEFKCGPFSALRRALRFLVLRVQEDDSFSEAAQALRYTLVEWLSAPVAFSELECPALLQLGSRQDVRRRWGEEASLALAACEDHIRQLRSEVNPLRDALIAVLAEHARRGKITRTYCHRAVCRHFLSMPGWVDARTAFLHSWREYRDAEPFDTLIHVGPSRARGFASLPPAVLNSPRQTTLLQFVWSGLADDNGFGHDPLLVALGRLGAIPSSGSAALAALRCSPEMWKRKELSAGEDGDEWDTPEENDFQILEARPSANDMRSAVLVRLRDQKAVLYAPNARVIAARLDISGYTVATLLAEDLRPEDCLVRPKVEDVDLGGVSSRDGRYSTIWKQQLHREWQRDSAGLESLLSREGIDLKHMRSRIRDWCRPATTVIHAPQQYDHFRALVRALGIEADRDRYPRPNGTEWWKLAWREIAHSRGEAIQAGVQEQEIVREQIVHTLGGVGEALETQLRHGKHFDMWLPEGSGLLGSIDFWPVQGCDDGYRAPESLLGSVIALDSAFTWHA